MTLDEGPRAHTLRELLLELRAGFTLHRPILVDVAPPADTGPDVTVERTLSMQLPEVGEPTVPNELAQCCFVLLGGNRLRSIGDRPITVGRSRRCDVRIDNESVSKIHSSFVFDEARGYMVIDEHSRNGTRISDAPLPPGVAVEVLAGARICFGDAAYVFIDPATLRKLARLAT
jgi:pSer/pThr/pTyr-binding forkhead associated (FHA) protein